MLCSSTVHSAYIIKHLWWGELGPASCLSISSVSGLPRESGGAAFLLQEGQTPV